MLSRRPRSWAIPGRGIWAGLALTPIVIALVLMIAAAFGGSSANAGPTAEGSNSVSPATAKTRARPAHHSTRTPAQILEWWTPARMAAATNLATGKPMGPAGTAGSPHNSTTYYPNFRRANIARTVALFFCQPGPCTRPASNPTSCTGVVIGWDDPATTIPNNADTGLDGPPNVIWTAGRCVHQGFGLEAGWSDDVIACPAYLNGANQELGCWAWTSESTTPEWYTDNWESRDYGVIYLAPATQPAPPAPVGGCGATHDIGYAYIGSSVAAPNCNQRIGTLNFAYNLPRAQLWWAVGYHHPATGLNPPGPACAPPTGQGCGIPLTTQAQYAYTHAALTSNPAGGAADTGPGPNSIGAHQASGTDGNTGAAKVLGQGAGAPWIVGSSALSTATLDNGGWVGPGAGSANACPSGLECRFGVSRLNSNTSYADVGEDDRPLGQIQGPYFDTVTCFDYQSWTSWPGTC